MKVALLSSGVDFVKRGYESHIIELFQSLKGIKGPKDFEIFLFKNTGKQTSDEIAIHALDRRSKIVGFLAKYRGDKLYWESVFYFLKLIRVLHWKQLKLDVVYVQEPVIAKLCFRLKKLIPGSPVVLFKHGVSNSPAEIKNTFDKLIQINVEHYERYLQAYPEDRLNVSLIPNFLSNDFVKSTDNFSKDEWLKKQGISTTKKIILLVGIINSAVKKTDYVINEVAKLDESWMLIVCGTGDEDIIAAGEIKLGERFKQLYLDKESLKKMYQSADVFVLASPNEGFGNVVLEAMAFEKPVVAHDRVLNRWILESDEALVDMNKEGSLSSFLKTNYTLDWVAKIGAKNQKIFENRFTWNSVEKDVLKLIFKSDEKK
jgi:glycosyltransferase involved in cell wall biosynthesis